MESSSISVVIPSFNRWHTLPRAVRSVLAQTRAPHEVIVVDDGSTDGTADAIATDFPAVTLLRQENRGVAAARNLGVDRARGEWIAFLDSDDEWGPRKLERQLAALAAQPGYAICHTEEIWIRNGRRVNPRDRHRKSGGYIFQKCLPLCVISPSSVMIRRSLLIEAGGFDQSFPVCEDYDLWLRLCSRHPVLFVDEPLTVKYGGHDDQLSKSLWGMDRFRIRALENVLSTGGLGEDDKCAALQTIIDKMDVYIAGARKRGKHDEVTATEEKRRLYASQL
jgi:glycosyltransferase involved in cell wall biosynthesis